MLSAWEVITTPSALSSRIHLSCVKNDMVNLKVFTNMVNVVLALWDWDVRLLDEADELVDTG